MAVGNAFANLFWFVAIGGLAVTPAIAFLTDFLSRHRFVYSRALLAGVIGFLVTDYLDSDVDMFVDLHIDWEVMIIDWDFGSIVFIGILFVVFFLPAWITVAIRAKGNSPKDLNEMFA